MYYLSSLGFKWEGLSEETELWEPKHGQPTCFQVIGVVDMLPQRFAGYAPKVQ